MQRLAAILVLSAGAVACQTTQGLISGRVLDSRTARPIAGAAIACADDSTNTSATALSDDDGYYFLPLLPPGTYRGEDFLDDEHISATTVFCRRVRPQWIVADELGNVHPSRSNFKDRRGC